MKGRGKIEKRRKKKRYRKRKQKSARKCTFLSLPWRTIIHHYLDPVLFLNVHIHTHNRKVRNTSKWNSVARTALRYSTFALVRKEENEKKAKKELRKEEGTLKAALVTDLSNPGIRKYLLIPGFAVTHISILLSNFYLLKSTSFYLDFCTLRCCVRSFSQRSLYLILFYLHRVLGYRRSFPCIQDF